MGPGTCVNVYEFVPPSVRTKALGAIGDTYVRAGAFASANFGTAPQLRAKKGISPDNTRRSYVKFAVTEVQAGDHITLRLTGYLSNTTNPTLRTLLYAVSDTSWNEDIMTWYTRPNLDAMLASVVVSGTARQKFDIDVTRYVQQQKTAGHDAVSFALRNPTHSSAQAIFDSREAGLGGPRLIITRAGQ